MGKKVKVLRDGLEYFLDEKTANNPHVKSLGVTVVGDTPPYVRKFQEIPPVPGEEQAEAVGNDYASMKVTQLKSLILERGITTEATKKEDLIAALNAADNQ
jgi:hypothetical protein